MPTEVVDGTKANADAKLGIDGKQTPTYTAGELAKAVLDAKTSVLADANRLKAEADKALKTAQASQKRVDEMLRAQEAAELEANRDDPAELKRIRAEQSRKKAESEAAEVRAQLEDANARLAEREAKDKERERESSAREIATRLRVDPARLTKLAKFTDGSTEAIEEIAKDLPKLTNREGEEFTPDSNRSHGGSAQTEMDIRKDYIGGRITAVQRDEKLKAIGARL